MNRRSLDRGHWIVVAGACILLLAAVLNWWGSPSGVGMLPAASSGPGVMNDGRVLLIFLVSLAALMLVALPFATETPPPLDRTASYAILLLVALVAYVWRVIDIVLPGGRDILPPSAPGMWLALIGLIVFARGVFEIHDASRPRW